MNIIVGPSTQFIPKSWGYERWMVNNEMYCGKILFFAKNHKCSFHYHKLKDETFYVQSGRVVMLYSQPHIEDLEKHRDQIKDITRWIDEKQLQSSGIFHSGLLMFYSILKADDVFHIPPNLVHMVFALEDSTIIETSTHHEDSDSYRIVPGY
jgi:mannose-6-phosphate isomerase-like protein (cupin superfamily)